MTKQEVIIIVNDFYKRKEEFEKLCHVEFEGHPIEHQQKITEAFNSTLTGMNDLIKTLTRNHEKEKFFMRKELEKAHAKTWIGGSK